MLIWFALLIPVISSGLLWKFYDHRVLKIEFLAPFVTSVVVIVVCQLVLLHTQTQDVEFWGGLVTHAEHFEEWNETVPCSHTTYCESCSTNSSGVRSCTSYACGTDHLYDVDHHPTHYLAYDTNGFRYPIEPSHFSHLVKRFGNRTFVDLGRDYHTIDGDKYTTKWDNALTTAEVTTSRHVYENRVKASRSVFNYPEVTQSDIDRYELFEYPPIYNAYYQNPVLGHAGPSHKEGMRLLKLLNGYLGRKHQVHIYVLMFQGQTRKAATLQEALWVGGNKNEFIIAVGVDKSFQVEWADVISWTKAERLKLDTRYFVEEMETFDLAALSKWLKPHIQQKWERREFKEFEYLRVEPPLWAVLLTFLLTLLVNGGVCYYVVVNEHREPRV